MFISGNITKQTGNTNMTSMICRLAGVFFLTLFIGCMSFSSKAHAGSIYRVKGVDIYLALRSAMAFDANNEIGKIYNGQEVEYVSSGNSTYWYVYAPTLGNYGYVNKDYLVYVRDEYSSSNSISGEYIVTGVDQYLALRNAMAYDARNEIGKIYNGQRVEYISTGDSTYWYVYAPTLGKYGYVNKNYLKSAGGNQTGTQTYKVKGVDIYLALRNAMAYDAKNEIGKLYNGQTVEYVSTGDSTYWYVYAPSLGKYGYVNKNYLVKSSSGSEVMTGTWYYITDKYKDGIALHPTPDPDSAVLIRLPYDTEFFVTERSGKYGYTTYQGFSGWINLDYAESFAW